MSIHRIRKYRLPIILAAVLIAALAWGLVAFAGSKNYDANNDGQIDGDEFTEVARAYMRGEVTQEEAVDHLLWAFSGMPRYGPIPTATPTPSPTPTNVPTLVPTPRPIPTSTLVPTDEPIPRLDCNGITYTHGHDMPIKSTSRHIDITVVHPAKPEGSSEGSKPTGGYWFLIIENYRSENHQTVDQEGFLLVVYPFSGAWQYKVIGSTSTSPSTTLATGYFAEDGIPFNAGWSAENRLTFLTRSPGVDEYRFYVNGYKVPIPFSGIAGILSRPHEPYKDGRYYTVLKSYYGARYSFADLCIPKSWVAD